MWNKKGGKRLKKSILTSFWVSSTQKLVVIDNNQCLLWSNWYIIVLNKFCLSSLLFSFLIFSSDTTRARTKTSDFCCSVEDRNGYYPTWIVHISARYGDRGGKTNNHNPTYSNPKTGLNQNCFFLGCIKNWMCNLLIFMPFGNGHVNGYSWSS